MHAAQLEAASPPPSARLPWRVVLASAAGQFGTGLLPSVLITWMMYFYSEPEAGALVLISPALFGTIRLVDRAAGAVLEPTIGYWSDRLHTRWGRRIPWIVIGTPFMCLSFGLLWFPPHATETNDVRVVVQCCIALIVYYAAYTAVVAPFVSLLPELTADQKERVRLSVWMSVFDVLSNIASAVAGLFVAVGAVWIFANGYQLLGVVLPIAVFISFMLVAIYVREPPHKPEHDVPFSLMQAIRESLKNPEFVPYACAMGGVRYAITLVLTALPFLATQLMNAEEDMVVIIQVIIIVVAAGSFPIVSRLADRHGKARVFRWAGLGYMITLPLMGTIGLVPGLPPFAHGVVLFALSAFSTACVFVLPRALIADVIDVDEKRTGYRREAMYNGMAGVVERLAEALAMGTAGWMFAAFGQTSAQPLGLRLLGAAAAIGVASGFFVFRKYSVST